MTPITISQTGTGRSAIVVPDSFQKPFNVGIQLSLSGTATFSVEVTMDDAMNTPASAVWSAVTGLSALTAGTVASMTIPCHGLSINVTSGTGTVTAKIVQAGVR
ncbi:hypothetical protein [Caudoviricetes sp.]|nr:hypothetical protein [Caudoviricetes sp.]